MILRLGLFRNLALKHHTRILTRSHNPEEIEKTLAEITGIVASDEEIQRLLRQFGAGPDVVRRLYHFLVQGGADRWIHGNYVAALSMTNPIVLQAFLRDRDRWNDRNFCLGFADTCIRHIEGGYTETFLLRHFGLQGRTAARCL